MRTIYVSAAVAVAVALAEHLTGALTACAWSMFAPSAVLAVGVAVEAVRTVRR